MMRRCKAVRGANNSLAPSTRPEDRVGHSADSSLSRAARVPWLWRRDGIAHKRGKKEAKGKERKKKKGRKKSKALSFACTPFCRTPGTARELRYTRCTEHRGARKTHMARVDVVYVRTYAHEREKEREAWGERLSIFFVPKRRKHRDRRREVVRGTETDNVKAHTANRPVTPRSYVT